MDEILVVPNRALMPDEKEYALCFAIPSDHPEVKQVVSFHNSMKREVYKKGFEAGYTDSYIISDDTFVPWEKVFLCGETQHGGVAALLFRAFPPPQLFWLQAGLPGLCNRSGCHCGRSQRH